MHCTKWADNTEEACRLIKVLSYPRKPLALSLEIARGPLTFSLLVKRKQTLPFFKKPQKYLWQILPKKLRHNKRMFIRAFFYFAIITNSVRLFKARPASVLLSATGFVAPNPLYINRVILIPLPAR